MKQYLKVVPNDWKNASRDKRELSVAKELGYDVKVIAKGQLHDKFVKDIVDDYTVFRFTTRPLNIPEGLNSLNRVIAALLWAKYIRAFHAELISCHDLIALFIGYLSTLFLPAKKKPLLIYDSHEFEIARNAKRSKFYIYCIRKLEEFLIKKTTLNIMVNDTIADEVTKLYHLDERPLVIRNIPNFWDLNEAEILKCRRTFLKYLNISSAGFIIMYHGLICKGNGIDIAIKALRSTSDVGLVILGYTHTPGYIDYLHQLIDEYNLNDRCYFHEAVPIDELYKYVGAADLGMLIFEAVTQSYYYTLPNKFFENIQSLTPVLCSDFPELHKLVKKYNIGFLCDPNNEMQVSSHITFLQENKEIYNNLKTNLVIAKNDLNWENEKLHLIQALKKITKGYFANE